MVPILALILLLWTGPAAGAQRVDLVDEVYNVPAHEWRYLDFTLKQLPVAIAAEYDVIGGNGSDVRLLLVHLPDARRVRERHLNAPLIATPPSVHGKLNHHLRVAGDYVVVIDNRSGAAPAPVHLRVNLNFGPVITYLSPQRRLTVIVVSFIVFFGIVGWSARRLMRAMR
jgi:hypothetical protein